MRIDLESVNDLTTEADVEGFIADGAPADEYESEVEDVFAALVKLPAEEATKDAIVAIYGQVWKANFSLSDEEVLKRRAAFEGIVERILHHFG
jgi:hypothetical protein